MVGTTLSHYKVIEKIGQGRMGVVYRAQATSLKREVAIKPSSIIPTLLPSMAWKRRMVFVS